MDKIKNIRTILRFSKGLNINKQFSRTYIQENGKKVLIKEIEAEYEPVEVTYKFDNLPLTINTHEQR